MKLPMCIGLASLALASWARAADENDHYHFAKGTQDFALTARYESNVWFSQQDMYTVSPSYGYYFLDNISINPTLNFHYANEHEDDIVGADFSLSLRWHFWNYEKWSAFVQPGVGAGYYDHRYPPGSSHFNFTAGGTVALAYEISDGVFLMGGPRLDHYSNASIWGSDRHQSYNNLGAFIGLMWTF